MTSVFYDVIHLESVRGRSNVLIENHFWRFLGNLNPKMLLAIVWTPKRHFLTSQRVFWDISHKIPCTGCFSRRVREKKKRPYISRISPGAPLRPIGTNFELRVRLVDVINRNAMSPLTLLELTFPLWRAFTWTLSKSHTDLHKYRTGHRLVPVASMTDQSATDMH